MTVENVPTLYNGTARYRRTVALDGVNFVLYFSWNSRDKYWYLRVNDGSDNPLSGFTSRKLVANHSVGSRSTDPDRPYGGLLVVSSSHQDPGLSTLGTDTILHYIPADVLEEIIEESA